MPLCPSLNIILVVAIFKESLKSVMMSIKVGNVVKSVGFGIYKEISIIKTETDKEIVKKKSNTELGKGTIIIANIAIMKNTTVRSLAFIIGSIYGAMEAKNFCLFLAKFYRFLVISFSVMFSRNSSIFI